MVKPKGFLIDLDGVLYIEDRLLPGAVDAMNYLREEGYPLRFLTNTTMRSRFALVEKLRAFGIHAELEEMFSTCVVATHWLRGQGISKVYLLLRRAAQEDFADFRITDDHPEAVVVGDLGSEFSFDVLNHAFRLIRDGARLIALQKNRFWQRDDGLALDVGPFVVALEYATEKEASVIGKPTAAYFETALHDLGLSANQGGDGRRRYSHRHSGWPGHRFEDHPRQDREIRVQRRRESRLPARLDPGFDCRPDWTLDSIADLPALLEP